MHILVLMKMVPDIIEELEVAPDGKTLATDFLRLIINERDNHALEQALLLKERYNGKVTVVGLEAPEVEDTLFTALAKGADRAVKLTGLEPGLGTRGLAELLAETLPKGDGLWPADLVLTGCQAIDDLDGMIAPLLGHALKMPYLGLITRVELDAEARKAVARKEYAGGMHGEFELALPAILGIQAAEKPPRYVPVAKVRAAMKSLKIDEIPVAAPLTAAGPPVEVLQMSKPEAAGHAEMIEGSPEEVAEKICGILAERGLL